MTQPTFFKKPITRTLAQHYTLIAVLVAILSLFISLNVSRDIQASAGQKDSIADPLSDFERNLKTLLSARSAEEDDKTRVYAFYQPMFEPDSTALDTTTSAITTAVLDKVGDAPKSTSVTILLTDPGPRNVQSARLEVLSALLADTGAQSVRLGVARDTLPGLRVYVFQK
jgi:hypothetical protein